MNVDIAKPIGAMMFLLLAGQLSGCAGDLHLVSISNAGTATCKGLPAAPAKCGDRDCGAPSTLLCCSGVGDAEKCRAYEYQYLHGSKGEGIYFAEKIARTGQGKDGAWQYDLKNTKLRLSSMPITEKEEINLCEKVCGPGAWEQEEGF